MYKIPTILCLVLTSMSLICTAQNEHSSKSRELDSLKKSLAGKTTRQQGIIYFEISRKYSAIDRDSGSVYANHLMNLAVKTHDEYLRAQGLYLQGYYLYVKKDFQGGIMKMRAALEIHEKADSCNDIAFTYQALA